MQLQNHRVVIVGGTSGIGLATAKLFLSQGAEVSVASRSQEKVNVAVHELGSKAQGYAMDFQDESQTKQFFDKIGDFDHADFRCICRTSDEGRLDNGCAQLSH